MSYTDKRLSKIDDNSRAITIVLCGIIGIFAIILFVMCIVPIIQQASSSPRVSLNIAPTSANITINGKEYHNGLYEMSPGNYTATISQEGFSPKELQFEVKNHGITVVNDYILNEKEGLYYFESSDADMTILQNSNQPEVRSFLNEFEQKKSILSKLPFEDVVNENENKIAPISNIKFKISDGSIDNNCKKIFCLLVTSGKTDMSILKKAVSKKIKEEGFDPDGYQIIYVTR